MRLQFALALALMLTAFAAAPAVERNAPAEPPAAGKKVQVEDFALLDHHGVFHQLTAQRDVPVVLLYVFAAGCPIVRHNVGELQRLAGEYAGKGVRTLLIDASQDTRAAVVEDATAVGLSLPVLLDESQLVAEGLGVTRTAEALVVRTKDWSIAWRGPLDDRVGYGAQKEKATHTWLADALAATIAGSEPVADPAAVVKGCAITFAKARATHQVDYAKDVAPILNSRCRECHQKGGIGPWSMENHKKVSGWAEMMREVIRTRAMPPWGADREYGSFSNDCALTVDEMRTVVHWIENGAKPSASDPLAEKPPKPAPEWPLGRPDLIVDLPEQQIPATGVLPYRMAEVSVPLAADTWVRAVDLRPSNRKNMHHAFAFISGDEEMELPDDIAADPRVKGLLDALKGRPLPPELKARMEKRPRGLTSFFASYVPGLEPSPFPSGTGKLLPKNAKLTFQMHYTTNGVAGTDRPRLGLYFVKSAKDKVEHELKVTSAFQLKLSIPPQTRETRVEGVRTFLKDEVIHALSPHMHYRGSSMRFVAEYPDGSSETLLSVAKYDLDWQRTYRLAKPKPVPAGTRLRCIGVFDNSATNEKNPDPNKAARFGEQSWDEMFIGYVVYNDAVESTDSKTKR
jgi:peroxiredoxin